MFKNKRTIIFISMCLFILTSVPIASCSEKETTNYQDSQWLATYTANSLVVGNGLIYLGAALENNNFTAENSDFKSASTYANTLYSDSQKAMDDSALYNVSPDLQNAKDEYQLEMMQVNSAAVYISYGIEEYKKGNVEAGDSDFEQAGQSLKSVIEHADRTEKLLKTYRPKN